MRIALYPALLVLACIPLPGETSPTWSVSDAALRELGVAEARRAAFAAEPATRWETALMTGNGEMGALAMGRTEDETLILSRGGVFLPFTPPLAPPSQGAHLREIRAMIAAGDYQKAADFVYELAQGEGYSGTHWVDPFTPLCSLRITSPQAGESREYVRAVDYATGVVGTRWTNDAGLHVRRVFASRADDVLVLSLTREGGPVDCEIGFVHHDPRVSKPEDKPAPDAFNLVKATATEDAITFLSRFARAWKGSLQGAAAAGRIIARGGTTEDAGDRVRVRGATEVLVLVKLTGIPLFDTFEPAALAAELDSLPTDFQHLLERHRRIHGELFARSRIDLGGSEEEHRLAAKDLFARSTLEKPLPALLEKQYDACRYLILSATGKNFPPTLQGIWSGTWSPPWSSAFTHDGNLPVAVIGNLPAAMPELMEGFFSYHERHLPHYRDNARTLFNARGIVVPAHSTSFGWNNHFGPRWCLTFWSAGAAWAAHSFHDYYLYTGDRAFLRERAVPFMKEVALFYEDFLKGMEGDDGYVVFSPSYSPENDPGNTGSQASLNATMDVAACGELLRNLVGACETLGIEAEGIERWKALRAKLPPYRINEDGAVAEWATPLLEDNHAHRHVSHLYELYDSLPDHIGGDPALRRAFTIALQKRTAWRRRIGGGEMAFGQAQMGAVAAALRMPDIAYENLGMLSKWFWFPESMMTAHNPQSLFNTDIAGGIPQLMILMLVDAQPGWIDVLPALPEDWTHGKIAGVRCRGQITVKSLEWTSARVRLVLVSAVDQTIQLRSNGGKEQRTVQLTAGEEASFDL